MQRRVPLEQRVAEGAVGVGERPEQVRVRAVRRGPDKAAVVAARQDSFPRRRQAGGEAGPVVRLKALAALEARLRGAMATPSPDAR